MHDGSHVPASTRVFALNCAGAIWWIGDQLARHGPRWELVPPILCGIASLIGAARSWTDGIQRRRHREEEHRVRLSRVAFGPSNFDGKN